MSTPTNIDASKDAFRHPTPDEFAHSVTNVAVAHLAIASGSTDPRPPSDGITKPGFTSADTKAVRLLSDVIGRYIETLGLSASENANAAGRASTNAYDVLNAFGSLTPKPLTIKELHTYARDKGLEVPFDREVSDFPKCRDRKSKTYGSGVSSAQFNSASRPAHVPDFLPPLPELDKRVKVKKNQTATEKSKKRIRQEAETQAALTALHGGNGGTGNGSSSSNSNNDNNTSGSGSGSGALDKEPDKKKQHVSMLRYQAGSGTSASVNSDSSGKKDGSGSSREQQILNGTYKQ